MNSKLSQLKNSRVKFEISVGDDRMRKYFEEAYIFYAPQVTIPGFRAGKAPKAMVIESVGRQKLANMAIEEGVRQGYIDALKEHSIDPVGNPSINIINQPLFVDGEAAELKFEAEVDTLPEVKFAKPYNKLKVSRAKEEDEKATDADVDEAVEFLRRRNSTLKPIERPAAKGDRIEIDFQGFERHVPIESLSSQNHPIILGQSSLIPGFEDHLIGMKNGEVKEFDLTFPKEHYAKQYAGKKYNFKVTVKSLNEVVLPELNNEFATKLGAKDINELKKLIKGNLSQEKKDNFKRKQEDEIVNQLADIFKGDVPESLVEGEKERLRQTLEETVKKQGMPMEEYLRGMKSTPEKFEEDLIKQSKRNVKSGLSMRQIALSEKIEIGKDGNMQKVLDWIISQSIGSK